MNIYKILTLEGDGHVFLTCGKVIGKVHPVTSHEGTEGKAEV
jgi:hypothetical protein